MFDLDNCISFVTNHAAKELADILHCQLIRNGITKSQWIAMYYIYRENTLAQKDLARLMSIKESTLKGILDRIQKENLIVRRQSSDDKRVNQLSLTKKGIELTLKLTQIAEEFRDACLRDISTSDQDIFLSVLQKMTKSAKEWQEEMR